MERAVDYQDPHLMTDEWKGFMSIGQQFAAHGRVRHSADGYARGPVHANSAESFNNRVRRTITGVFQHISPEHADLYFNEIGFRWSQRVVAGQTVRRSPKRPRKRPGRLVSHSARPTASSCAQERRRPTNAPLTLWRD
jgi:hypothetical protein